MELLREHKLNLNRRFPNQQGRKKNKATEATKTKETIQKPKLDEKPEVDQLLKSGPETLLTESDSSSSQERGKQTTEQEPTIKRNHTTAEPKIINITTKPVEEVRSIAIKDTAEVTEALYIPERAEQVSIDEPAEIKVLDDKEVGKTHAQEVDIDSNYLSEYGVLHETENPFQDINEENEITAVTKNSVEVYTDEQLELLFEAETIETYKELLALTAESLVSEVASAEPAEIEVSSLTESGVDLETVTSSSFKTFVSEQAKEAVTLESIQERITEQPVEKTLVQLAQYLAEPTEEPMQKVLAEIVQDLEKAMPTRHIADKTEEIKLHITPEMTEKLLALLRALGYQNPREALVGLVAQHGPVYLLDVLKYTCQLNNRREILATAAFISTTNDDSIQQRFGKAILTILQKYTSEPRVNLVAVA